MPRRNAVPLVAAALVPLLAACGSSASSGLGGKSAPDFSAVSVSGSVGAAPKVTWKSQMTAKSTVTKTLVKGTGAALQDGGSAYGYIWLGNGYSKQKAFSDYDQGSPEDLTLDKNLSKTFTKMLTGAKIGSRTATVTKASNIFGAQGNPQLGIGNEDPVLVIVDLVAPAVDKATDVTPDKLPKLQLKNGKPAGFDFTGIAKPEQYGDLLRTTLKQGKGPAVTADETVKVNYLGETYQGTKPFDQSYVDVPASGSTPAKKAGPATFPLNQVVKGWTLGLTGVKVGSRVLLQIPPVLGYGGKAQPNIPANSTLFFVVDVLSATKASASAAPSGSPSAQ